MKTTWALAAFGLLIGGAISGCTHTEQLSRTYQHPAAAERCFPAGEFPAATCHTFLVPEDYALPEARKMKMRVAVLRGARAPAGGPASVPVVILAGGPGQSVIEMAGAIRPLIDRIAADQDVVLIDQRGMGGSTPLACGTDVPSPETVGSTISSCLARLGHHPANFSSAHYVQDIANITERLGYEQVSLLAFSYGTEVAQKYIDAYGHRVVRVVLDGAVALPMPRLAYLNNLERSLAAVFQQCERDPQCRHGGSLRDRFDRVHRLARDGALKATKFDATSQRTREARVAESELLAAFQRLLAGDNVLAEVMAAIVKIEAGSYDFAGERDRWLGGEPAFNSWAHYAVVCTSDNREHLDPDAMRAAEKLRFFPLLGHEIEICKAWPRQAQLQPPRRYRDRSAVPALLLSGADDPFTPPAWADQVALQFATATHLVIPGAKHTVAMAGCVPGIIGQFLRTGRVDSLPPPGQTGCPQQP